MNKKNEATSIPPSQARRFAIGASFRMEPSGCPSIKITVKERGPKGRFVTARKAAGNKACSGFWTAARFQGRSGSLTAPLAAPTMAP